MWVGLLCAATFVVVEARKWIERAIGHRHR
jgi:hypothetical protein